MVKINSHNSVNLDILAESHYQSMIAPLLKDGVSYHSTNSLIGRIEAQRVADAADAQKVEFWDYFLANKYQNLKRIIVSRPAEYEKIIAELKIKFGSSFLSNSKNYNTANLTKFGLEVKRIFNYALYRGKPECIDNCEKLNISFCPYCNILHIQVIDRIDPVSGINDTLALLQLDHFYPQSRHPYLAVSFFNMIPGCGPCNAQLKLEKEFSISTHFNPFDKSFDDYFMFRVNSINPAGWKDVDIQIHIKKSYPINAIRDFQLITRYNKFPHKNRVFKLLSYFRAHNKKVNNSLVYQIKGLFIDKSAVTSALLDGCDTPLVPEDINSVYLGKLKRDLAYQLKIL